MTSARTITATDAKARLGEVLASLATEGPVEITRNGRSIAVLATAPLNPRVNEPHLAALAAHYAAGAVTWRKIADETGASFGELLVELGRQGLQLPTNVAVKRPAQLAMFDAALRAARGT